MNAYLQRALLLFEQGKLDLAEGELRQALTLEPDDAFAHALLALILSDSKDFKQATEEAQQAVHLGPDEAFSHYAMGHVCYDRNNYKGAAVAAKEAIRLSPDDARYYALLAQIQMGEFQWKNALATAEMGLVFEPDNVVCTNLRAIALVKLGRNAEAGTTIDAALARDPENAVTHANQGWAFLHQNKIKEALPHFREALRLDPQSEWARAGIVEALKARNPIYAVMLRYFLWMSKLSPRAQWGIIAGGAVGNQILRGLAKTNPHLAPFILPLCIAYLVFVFLTWTSDSLFNLLLRFDRFGRLTLTDDQVKTTNFMGSTLVAAVALLGIALLSQQETSLYLCALGFALMVFPIASLFKCPTGWPRTTAIVITSILTAVGVMGIAFGLIALTATGKTKSLFDNLGWVAAGAQTIGAVAMSWGGNFLMMQRPKRR